MLKPRFITPVLFLTLAWTLGACSASASPTPQASPSGAVLPIALNPGNYTALGVNPKSAQPTPSDLADLQAAESGTLKLAALVEFYGDT
jgi:hypothetical protein